MEQNITGDTAGDAEQELSAVFRDKPEMVIDLSHRLLSPLTVAGYRRMENLAIVEIAGRDSIAAAIRAVEISGYTDLLPVYAYTGSETGPWATVVQAVGRLEDRLQDVRVHPLLAMGSPGFWRALNGRFISDLIARFGAYTPCAGCHLYLHAVRVPLAKMLGSVPIIAGERESHSGQTKVNQLGAVLDIYGQFTEAFGIRLEMPLRHVDSGSEIEAILGMDWQRGKDQLGCCLSGNYIGSDDNVDMDEEKVSMLLTRFSTEAARRILLQYLDGSVPDHISIAKEVIKTC